MKSSSTAVVLLVDYIRLFFEASVNHRLVAAICQITELEIGHLRHLKTSFDIVIFVKIEKVFLIKKIRTNVENKKKTDKDRRV